VVTLGSSWRSFALTALTSCCCWCVLSVINIIISHKHPIHWRPCVLRTLSRPVPNFRYRCCYTARCSTHERTTPWQHVCPSVHSSVTLVSKRLNILKLYSPTAVAQPSNVMAIFRRESPRPGVECRWAMKKYRDFWPISRFISEMIHDRAIVTMERQRELLLSMELAVLFPMILNDLESLKPATHERQCWLSFLSADIVGRQWVNLSFAETKAETLVWDQQTGLRPN